MCDGFLSSVRLQKVLSAKVSKSKPFSRLDLELLQITNTYMVYCARGARNIMESTHDAQFYRL